MELFYKSLIFWITFGLYSLLGVTELLSDDNFDCKKQNSCETCFNSKSNNCDWCPKEKICTHDAAKNCGNIPYTLNSTRIPSGKYKDFSIENVNVNFDICIEMPNLKCSFNIEGRSHITNASVKNDKSISCKDWIFEYAFNSSNITVDFAIFWQSRSSDSSHILYTSSLVTYGYKKCQHMAHDQTTCIMLHETYKCEWCQSTNSCEYRTSTNFTNNCIKPEKSALTGPKILNISPHEGPTYGGTVLTIEGENFNSVKHIQVFIGNTTSQVFSHTSNEIKCITNSSPEKEMKVVAEFDGKNVSDFSNNSFKYIRDRSRDENGFNIKPTGIPAGGVTILIHNISLIPNQELIFNVFDGNQNYSSSCSIQINSTIKCLSPHIPNIHNGSLNVKYPLEMEYSLKNKTTGENISNLEIEGFKFLLFPNPKFNYFFNSSVLIDDKHFVIIQGHDINNACHKTDITVNVGDYNCEVKSISSNQLICQLLKNSSNPTTNFDQEHDILAGHDYVNVSIGEHFKVSVPKQGLEAPKKDVSVVVIYGAAIFLAIVVTLLLLVSCHFLRRRKIIAKTAQKLKQMQQRMNAVDMETIAVRQCIKNVIVKNQINLDGESLNILKLPNVTIEYATTSIPKNSTNTLSQTHYILPLDDKWEFPRSKLVLGESLGEGEFGKVVKGEALGILPEYPTTTVAVKMLKNNSSDSDMIDLVSEMEIMKSIGTHDNVLKLLGCCTQDGDLLIITEFAYHGNLRDFLRRHILSGNNTKPLSELSVKKLLNFALEVAEGMEYLASIKCIHRDLAARNILVSENYTMKIGDFGLARDIQNKDYYRRKSDGRLPLKWMAPEALCHSIFSTQSDVWSYGILLWEIFTLGGSPYPSFMEMEKLYQALHSGYRMEKPPNCSDKIFHLMRKCWSFLPDGRPTFSKIAVILEKILLNDEV